MSQIDSIVLKQRGRINWSDGRREGNLTFEDIRDKLKSVEQKRIVIKASKSTFLLFEESIKKELDWIFSTKGEPGVHYLEKFRRRLKNVLLDREDLGVRKDEFFREEQKRAVIEEFYQEYEEFQKNSGKKSYPRGLKMGELEQLMKQGTVKP